MRRLALTFSAAAGAVLCTVPPFASSPAEALPLYTARSGRTCDNCHVDPTDWENPPLPDRKCTLSCMGCHTDPSGGGLRTVSGEFYGQSTLPMFLPSHRGWEDWERGPFWTSPDEKRSNKVPDLAWGSPAGEPTVNTWDQARYAGLNADPALSLGIDARVAAWLMGDGEASVFPMQFDTHAAVHPIERVTVAATAGVIADKQGFGATFERNTAFAVKDVYAMVHELPYMTYVRAGRFVPPFGTRTEDHTSPIRRDFELDGSTMHSRVTGVELGFAPNYPYAQVAVFRPGPRDDGLLGDGAVPVLGVPGIGVAASAGYRDLGWQLGASAMLKRRPFEFGGDTESVSLQGAFNPWYYTRAVPLTFLGEYAVGRRQNPWTGGPQSHVAGMLEADLLVFNGLNLRLKYDFSDPDTVVGGDQRQTVGLGADVHLMTNTTVTGQVRVDPNGGDPAYDAILFLHLWL
ncbi:MAG: hypothetical protein ACI8PZ_005523 [Myxococcota bacterium]|jgi:hypothetical protein